MTVRQIIADFWVQLERETGEIPYSIALRGATYDKLVAEFGEQGSKALVAESRLKGSGFPALKLTHANGQEVVVVRAPEVRGTSDG